MDAVVLWMLLCDHPSFLHRGRLHGRPFQLLGRQGLRLRATLLLLAAMACLNHFNHVPLLSPLLPPPLLQPLEGFPSISHRRRPRGYSSGHHAAVGQTGTISVPSVPELWNC